MSPLPRPVRRETFRRAFLTNWSNVSRAKHFAPRFASPCPGVRNANPAFAALPHPARSGKGD
jgi:hypothetical protein